MTNNADLKKPTDLDPPSLLRQGLLCSARERLSSIMSKKVSPFAPMSKRVVYLHSMIRQSANSFFIEGPFQKGDNTILVELPPESMSGVQIIRIISIALSLSL